MEEKWLPIKGYEGLYEVSNLGKIASISNGKRKEKTIRISKNGHGFVELYKKDKRKGYTVASLVAQAFLPDYLEGKIVHFKDNNSSNVKADNLFCVATGSSYGFPSENVIGKTAKGTVRVKYKGKEYDSVTELAKAYNIKYPTLVKRLKNGWTLEEALEIKRQEWRGKIRLYEYKGQLKTLTQISKLSGIKRATLCERLDRGWCTEEAFEIPVNKYKKGEN